MIEIVPFEAKHAEGVIGVILPIQRNEFSIPITLDDQPDLRNIPTFYQHGAGNFWVALNDGIVVGTIALLDIGANQAALRKMFVAASYRGREYGVAQGLLDALVNSCRGCRVQDIFLGTTAPMKAAHRFYEKNGFNEVAPEGLPKSFPIMKVDTKFYHRPL